MICDETRRELQAVLDRWKAHTEKCTPCALTLTVLKLTIGHRLTSLGVKL